MGYLFAILVFLIGVIFHITRKISYYKKTFHILKLKNIIQTFLKEEWDSFIGSGCVLLLVIAVVYFVKKNNLDANISTVIIVYCSILLSGYAGQRFFFNIFKTSEDVLYKKAESILSIKIDKIENEQKELVEEKQDIIQDDTQDSNQDINNIIDKETDK